MSSLWEPVTHKELEQSSDRLMKASAKTGLTAKEAGENVAKGMRKYFEICRKDGACKVEEVGKSRGDNMGSEEYPLGVKPKVVWENERLSGLAGAIKEYIDSKKSIPIEWVEEYNELTSKVDD